MTPEQKQILKERLLDLFNPDSFAEFLQDRMEGLIFRHYVGNLGFRIQIQTFIRVAEENGFLPKLILEAAEARPHDLVLQELSQKASLLLKIGLLDPHERVVLRKRVVFINRRPLKSQLKFLTGSDSSWVLQIQGKPKTGLSYCWNFVRHLLEVKGCKRVLEIDLKKHVYARYQTQVSDFHLAETLNESMGLGISLPAHADHTTFKIQPFFNLFRNKLQASNEHFLLYLHQFDVAMSEDAIHFVQYLAQMVHADLSNVFLVLAGFDEGLPEEIMPFISEVETDSFSEEDMEIFFAKLYEEFPDIFQAEPDETKDEFVTNALNSLKEKVNFETKPNVKPVGIAVQHIFNKITQQMLR